MDPIKVIVAFFVGILIYAFFLTPTFEAIVPTSIMPFLTGIMVVFGGQGTASCPHPAFIKKHVCIDCKDEKDALEFSKPRRFDTGRNTVVFGTPGYKKIDNGMSPKYPDDEDLSDDSSVFNDILKPPKLPKRKPHDPINHDDNDKLFPGRKDPDMPKGSGSKEENNGQSETLSFLRFDIEIDTGNCVNLEPTQVVTCNLDTEFCETEGYQCMTFHNIYNGHMHYQSTQCDL